MHDIAETAYLVAMYRALASEQPQAKFRDPFARSLAGSKGEFLLEIVGDQVRGVKAMAIRTRAIDRMLQRLIAAEGVDTVINLGAGLDARPYRLPFPSTLRWIELDFPEILRHKEQILQATQPFCVVERYALDFTDIDRRNSVLEQINITSSKLLVIMEGVLSYLTESQVADLATTLGQQSHCHWWLFDLASPFVLQKLQNYQPQQIFEQYFADGQPTFLFAPIAGTEFFTPYGWQVKEFRSVWAEWHHLHQCEHLAGLTAVVLKVLARKPWSAIAEKSGFALLERSNKLHR